MKQKIFFQSSLPRSGSTLLQNLLGQNPDIHPTPTSGFIDLILGARIGYNKNIDISSENSEEWKRGFYSFCREGIRGYLAEITNKPYILDKNRDWGPYYSLISNIIEKPKILFMVRDLRAIFSSMEKKFRENPEYNDGLQDNSKMLNLTTLQRVQYWSNSFPIGYALTKLQQSILDRTASNFLFIRYEHLCSNPHETLEKIYNYLEIPYFYHNTEHIPQVTIENDSVHGIYGDHTIRNSLEKLPDDFLDILGEEVSDWVYYNFKDYFNIFNYKK